MAVFDASFLIYLFDSDVKPPNDPETGQPVKQFKERVEFLVKRLEQDNEKIVIPTPALSEYLIKAGEAGVEVFQYLQNKDVFDFADFDVLAAFELSELNKKAIYQGDKTGGVNQPWQKTKLDRQIVAIAKVSRENVIYSGDSQLHVFASQANMRAFGLWDLELPPEDAQQNLDFERPGGDQE